MDSSHPAGQSQHASGQIWRFADCEFDERRRELRVRGTAVDIEAKPLEVLHELLLHADEVVTKAELLESVWPGTAVVDGSLATAISKVRKLLGDDGTVVVTVPRVGYKLAVPVYLQTRARPGWSRSAPRAGTARSGSRSMAPYPTPRPFTLERGVARRTSQDA